MSPKPNSYLRLQDIYIKSNLEHGLKIAKGDFVTQNALVELMLLTNEKTIQDWINQLEQIKKTKSMISRDLIRFEEQVHYYNEEQQKLKNLLNR